MGSSILSGQRLTTRAIPDTPGRQHLTTTRGAVPAGRHRDRRPRLPGQRRVSDRPGNPRDLPLPRSRPSRHPSLRLDRDPYQVPRARAAPPGGDLTTWRVYFSTGRICNGPVDAVNLLIKNTPARRPRIEKLPQLPAAPTTALRRATVPRDERCLASPVHVTMVTARSKTSTASPVAWRGAVATTEAPLRKHGRQRAIEPAEVAPRIPRMQKVSVIANRAEASTAS